MLSTVEMVVVSLRQSAQLTSQLPNGALGISLGVVPAGTKAPYVVVMGMPSAVSYTLGNKEAYTNEIVDVWVYTRGNGVSSPESQAKRLGGIIYDRLQNMELTYEGRRILSIRYKGSNHHLHQLMTSEEVYFRAGMQWQVMTGPA